MVAGLEVGAMMVELSAGDLAAFLRVLLGVVLAFGIAPMVVLARPQGVRSFLDAYMSNLVRWFAIVIVIMHVLAGMGVFSRVSLLVVLFSIAWFGRYRREFGGFGGVLHRVFASDEHIPKRRRPPKPPRADRLRVAALAAPVFALLVASFVLRAGDAFRTVTLSPPDAYNHMTWADAFTNNQLWPDGVYPQGLSALVAFQRAFTPFTDIVDIARFTGPLVGTFLVFAIYYLVVRLTRNPGAALLAAGLFGLFGALPEWRLPWYRQIGLLPQEFAVAVALIAVVFAVLVVTERGGGRMLQLGQAGGLAMGGNVVSLFAAAFVAAMVHPLGAAWLGLIVGVAAIAATAVTRRYSHLVGAGVATVAGAGAGLGIVPLVELFGVRPYIGQGTVEVVGRLAPSQSDEAVMEGILFFFGELRWVGHNWLSHLALLFVGAAVVGVIVLVARPSTRREGAQLLALTAVAALVVALYDLSPFVGSVSGWYLVRLSNLLGPTLPIAFGAGLGGLAVIVTGKVTYLRVAMLALSGVVALGVFWWQLPSPAQAITENYDREEIEHEEMTRATLEIKREFDQGQYTVVGLTSQRQVLARHGWFIDAWVFARDVEEIPDDDILPVPSPDTFVFVELDPPELQPVAPAGPTEEYYLDPDKRGRIHARLVEWAERRRRENPDTTVYHQGERIRVYRISRNPAVRIPEDSMMFTDYVWRPGELFNEGPTSPREVLADFDTLGEPEFDEDDLIDSVD